ncbi:ATP-binding protein [Accumulibacter sp.]|uniref:ATP-binding protein n=1 Tax=Accumulibacter sp. TaxID=2053492 RepID=UPI0025D1B832|nr:ATP-binding protein [Accumulibacter sp.]MCM8612431.1 ATP-binding protein [Accumulibacter sp.]MCM8636828.1 ATP-binding protein [Accumulibacter sp.]MCM8641153.1 ATP-binding protein [Accumulibacter sp.]
MIEALRGLGYSTATALADLIDNSIAAGGNLVDIQFSWKGSASTIAVLDNGEGMDEGELDLAMRLGEKSPLDQRAAHDLGRFGLGLKTASFSQCRRLTVASRKAGKTNCLRWDLDVVAASDDDGWHLLEGPAEGSEALLSSLDSPEHGTLVLWEIPDRIVTPGFAEQDFLDLVDRIERHLAMVFHRFLCGPRPRLHLAINGRPVRPWDPFLIGHAATWSSPVERIAADGGLVEVQCYVLPHKDRLDAHEHDAAAGPDGWTAQQGFYVYRNERLLVAGSWLGLGRGRSWTKEEAHRLARIRLDIPNTADAEWKIDVRKSTARPPVSIRERLNRLAEDTRERARRVFAHRGQPVRTGNGGPLLQAWRAEHFKGGIRYRIDIDHAAVRAVLDDAGPMEAQVRAMLRVIEETIPVQRIWLDTTEARETPRTGFAGEPSEEIIPVLSVIYRNMVLRNGMSPARAREQLLRTEPFNAHPDLVAALPDEPTPPRVIER